VPVVAVEDTDKGLGEIPLSEEEHDGPAGLSRHVRPYFALPAVPVTQADVNKLLYPTHVSPFLRRERKAQSIAIFFL
jgi:hypothetical protein